jgi:hypothetical protein
MFRISFVWLVMSTLQFVMIALKLVEGHPLESMLIRFALGCGLLIIANDARQCENKVLAKRTKEKKIHLVEKQRQKLNKSKKEKKKALSVSPNHPESEEDIPLEFVFQIVNK